MFDASPKEDVGFLTTPVCMHNRHCDLAHQHIRCEARQLRIMVFFTYLVMQASLLHSVLRWHPARLGCGHPPAGVVGCGQVKRGRCGWVWTGVVQVLDTHQQVWCRSDYPSKLLRVV